MSRYFDWNALVYVFPRLLKCIPVTVGITFASFAIGVVIAVLLAVSRVYRIPVANQFSILYVSFMRGTPILLQLFICKFALPGIIFAITGVNVGRIWPLITFVIIAYALNIAAFLSEIFRSAVAGVDTGQHEAAYTVGMTKIQSFTHIIFPQIFRIAIPGISNNLSNLLKDTSLAYGAAGVIDVIGMASASAALTYRFLEGYIGAAIIFFGLCVLIERGFTILSRRLDYGKLLTKEI
ncbi:MAG: amino acid ABC transporter permease [Treponema sp.]|jgi:L-cystine transport system permease protein|nr:amino acid ABC transporter permease [Treponema sp.]